MDRISVTGIEVFAHHGVLPHERELGQRFVVDLALELDLAPAAASDDVADTVHYGDLPPPSPRWSRPSRSTSSRPSPSASRPGASRTNACTPPR